MGIVEGTKDAIVFVRDFATSPGTNQLSTSRWVRSGLSLLFIVVTAGYLYLAYLCRGILPRGTLSDIGVVGGVLVSLPILFVSKLVWLNRMGGGIIGFLVFLILWLVGLLCAFSISFIALAGDQPGLAAIVTGDLKPLLVAPSASLALAAIVAALLPTAPMILGLLWLGEPAEKVTTEVTRSPKVLESPRKSPLSRETALPKEAERISRLFSGEWPARGFPSREQLADWLARLSVPLKDESEALRDETTFLKLVLFGLMAELEAAGIQPSRTLAAATELNDGSALEGHKSGIESKDVKVAFERWRSVRRF